MRYIVPDTFKIYANYRSVIDKRSTFCYSKLVACPLPSPDSVKLESVIISDHHALMVKYSIPQANFVMGHLHSNFVIFTLYSQYGKSQVFCGISPTPPNMCSSRSSFRLRKRVERAHFLPNNIGTSLKCSTNGISAGPICFLSEYSHHVTPVL